MCVCVCVCVCCLRQGFADVSGIHRRSSHTQLGSAAVAADYDFARYKQLLVHRDNRILRWVMCAPVQIVDKLKGMNHVSWLIKDILILEVSWLRIRVYKIVKWAVSWLRKGWRLRQLRLRYYCLWTGVLIKKKRLAVMSLRLRYYCLWTGVLIEKRLAVMSLRLRYYCLWTGVLIEKRLAVMSLRLWLFIYYCIWKGVLIEKRLKVMSLRLRYYCSWTGVLIEKGVSGLIMRYPDPTYVLV